MTQPTLLKKLSVITTLGPATSSTAIIKELLPLSSQFRLNSSHLSPEELRQWLYKLNKIFIGNNTSIPVVIDLQGAKMRVGMIAPVKQLPEEIILIEGNHSEDKSIIPVPHRRFFEHVQRGEELLLNDGKVAIKIIERTTLGPDNKGKISFKAKVISNGPLSARKGINRKKHPVPFNLISEKDKEIISILNEYDFTSIAISFIVNGSEIDLVRELSHKRIAAKIERPESFPHLETIALKSDEVWLCRGDLGAQAGLWSMARLQNQFESFIGTWKGKADFILAGQVFEHLTHAKEATRSEVTHFYNSSFKGYKGIVLSDETAIGCNPVVALTYIRKLQSEAQKDMT